MSHEAIRTLSETILWDTSLRQRLGELSATDAFVEEALRAASEREISVTREDIVSSLRDWRQVPSVMVSPTAGLLRHWIPERISVDHEPASVEWCYMGGARFTRPFFEDTLSEFRHLPINRLCRFQTTLDDLNKRQSAHPGLSPAGFIYHMSRCGSTLISQLLASLPQNIVISEAPIIDSVLSAHFRHPHITDEQRIAWLKGVIGALGQQRHPDQQNLFIKFDSWHTMALPLIHKAYPDVPWIFVARDPVEIMVSHARETGQQMVPGLIDPGWFDIEPNAGYDFLNEYCAKVLGKICAAALRNANIGRGRVVHYRQLPEVIWTWLPHYFGAPVSMDDAVRMQQAAGYHAKRPNEQFTGDSGLKAHSATASIRELAAQWADPHYNNLLSLCNDKNDKE